ncbi:hypothetical protein CH367_03995 [Leptospira barantonii]|uniref:Lipoprotein n=1 Tax=Leptospira barantonii TaxID=2023184 RepID=A0ABX4NRP5_9LEPT|nr:hypothetical protein [Leptospira barantonii]PJZ59385.1 hypothetical protein CH367_03995 [Leptospira barantonii]
MPSFPRIFGAFILFFFVFVQCASSKNFIFGTVFVRKGFTPDKKSRHVIFPVQIRTGWLMKNQNADQKKFLESRSYEKLELTILEYGGKVQDKYNAEKQYRTAFAAENSFSEERGIQIAKQLKGDVVVFTDMTDFGTASGNSVMEVTVKAMDVDNGEILWKAIYSGKARGLQDNIDISILESEIFEQLTEKLKNKTE